jgi:hypothetical protein
VEIVIEDSGDVHIQQQYDGETHEEADAIFEFDDAAIKYSRSITISSGASGARSHNHAIENSNNTIPSEVADTAEKLDTLLLLLIQFIDGQLQLAESNLSAAPDRIYTQLDAIFRDKILATHKSKFVQFALFYLLCKLPRCCELFSRGLMQIFFDESMPMIKRQAAVLYLASFLSRSKSTSIALVHDILSDLVTWCGSYASLAESVHAQVGVKDLDELGREILPDSSEVAAINRHESFFAGVQAACYICCFYGVEVGQQHRSSSCLHADWIRIVTSTADPLRYCCYSIRIEFLKLALQIGLLPEEVWDTMSLDLIRQEQQPSQATTKRFNPLDSFFPFDPCLLQAIHQRIEPFYRHWDGVPGLNPFSNNQAAGGYEDCVSADTDTDIMTMSQASSVSLSYSHMTTGSGIAMVTSLTETSYIRDMVLAKGMSDCPVSEEEVAMGSDGWPLPIRQPRHYSIGSTGSW